MIEPARYPRCRCSMAEAHRHLGMVEVSERLMRYLLVTAPKGHWWRIERGLPPDARLLAAEYDIAGRVYRFFFESPEFPATRDDSTVQHVVHITVEEFIEPSQEPPGVNLHFTPAELDALVSAAEEVV